MLGIPNRLAVVSIVCGLAAWTSTAEAAKGVKKAAAKGGQQALTGEVVKVQQNNGVGSFFLRTATNHRKRGVGQNVAGNQGAGREFQVNAATRFEGINGAKATLASLHNGERARVMATGMQANHVHILTNHSYHRMPHHYYGGNRYYHHRGMVHRHRPRTYVVHHHSHAHHARAAHHHGSKKR
jgi:hypothetical protein